MFLDRADHQRELLMKWPRGTITHHLPAQPPQPPPLCLAPYPLEKKKLHLVHHGNDSPLPDQIGFFLHFFPGVFREGQRGRGMDGGVSGDGRRMAEANGWKGDGAGWRRTQCRAESERWRGWGEERPLHHHHSGYSCPPCSDRFSPCAD